MPLKTLEIFLAVYIVCAFCFEDFIYVYGQGNKEMSEQGRTQYQMIKERGTLPRYGQCWKSAIDHINEGCRQLSEETQSDIALHITNCFLEMSGHETYNCELDKKPNLRSICISSMSDRAFNVYTEFYTHTQNICWFLRGQIWHETIAENTLKVGKQLEVSAENQENLIKVQKESIELQDKMLKQGRFLETVMEDIYISTKAHHEILKLLTQSVTNLQAWVIGEISWIDSIIFNITALFLILILTSSHRTESARFPLFAVLFLNLTIERLICRVLTKNQNDLNTSNLYTNIYRFVWYSRYAFTFLGAILLIYKAITFRNIFEYNVDLLKNIQHQNKKILSSLEQFNRGRSPSKVEIDVVNETFNREDRECSIPSIKQSLSSNSSFSKGSSEDRLSIIRSSTKRYNFRNRQGTPDSGVAN